MIDPAEVAALIVGRRLCASCMALKLEVSVEVVEATVRRTKTLVLLQITPERCDECGESRTIYSIPLQQ